jgi:hypothetical protein
MLISLRRTWKSTPGMMGSICPLLALPLPNREEAPVLRGPA